MNASRFFYGLAAFALTATLHSPCSLVAQTPETGVFRGQVRFAGEIPRLPPLVTQSDPNVKDAAVCAAKTIPDESLIVDTKTRGIANVYVYLRERPETVPAASADESKPPLILKVEGCRFVPHTMVMRTTERVKLLYKDQVPHNPHVYPVKSSVPGALIAPGDQTYLQEFDRAEPIPVKVGCDIHPWMEAYILPLDHPFAAITNQQGKFEIEGLPPGEYEFRIWQERAGWLEKQYKVTIEPGKSASAELSYTSTEFERSH